MVRGGGGYICITSGVFALVLLQSCTLGCCCCGGGFFLSMNSVGLVVTRPTRACLGKECVCTTVADSLSR